MDGRNYLSHCWLPLRVCALATSWRQQPELHISFDCVFFFDKYLSHLPIFQMNCFVDLFVFLLDSLYILQNNPLSENWQVFFSRFVGSVCNGCVWRNSSFVLVISCLTSVLCTQCDSLVAKSLLLQLLTSHMVAGSYPSYSTPF